MRKYIFPVIVIAALFAPVGESCAADRWTSDLFPLLDVPTPLRLKRSGSETDANGKTIIEWMLHGTTSWPETSPYRMLTLYSSTEGGEHMAARAYDEYDWSKVTWLIDWHYEDILMSKVYNYSTRVQIRCDNKIKSIGPSAFAHSNIDEFYYFMLRKEGGVMYFGRECDRVEMERIDRYAFSDSRLKYIEIGPRVTSIGEFAFYACDNLQTVVSYAVEPPAGETGFYQSNAPNATLVVPNGSVKKYRRSAQWHSFGRIVNMDGSEEDFLDYEINLDQNDYSVSLGETIDLKISWKEYYAGFFSSFNMKWENKNFEVVEWDINHIKLLATREGTSNLELNYLEPFGTAISNVVSCNITALPAKNDVTLAGLYTGDYVLTPSFKSHILNYSITVGTDRPEEVFHAIPHNPKATLILPGTPFPCGLSTYVISIRGEDNETVGRYTLYVDWPCNDATLKSIKVNSAEVPNFNPYTEHYLVGVPSSASDVEISAEPSASLASISGAGVKSLKENVDNEFPVEVTAPDGSKKTYLVIIRSLRKEVALKSLSFNTGDLSPAFHPDSVNYVLTIGNYYGQPLSLTPNWEAYDAGMLITVSEDEDKNGFKKITCWSEDGLYNLNYKWKTVFIPNDDDTLKWLTVSNTDIASRFDPDILQYTDTVGNSVSVVTLSAGQNFHATTLSGTGNHALKEGLNTLTVKTTAYSGKKRTYTIYIYRKSSNTFLRHLSLRHENGTRVEFDANQKYHSYTGAPGKITLSAEKAHERASLRFDSIHYILRGDNPLRVFVTNENGSSTSEYVINYNGMYQSTEITGLYLAGKRCNNFDGTLKCYYDTVAGEVNSVSMTYEVPGAGGSKLLDNITEGDNGFIFTVLSEDKMHSDIYRVNIYKLHSSTEIIDLYVNGKASENCDPDTKCCYDTVDAFCNSVTVGYRVANKNKLEEKTFGNIVPGNNTLSFTAVSEDGKHGSIYRIVVYKPGEAYVSDTENDSYLYLVSSEGDTIYPYPESLYVHHVPYEEAGIWIGAGLNGKSNISGDTAFVSLRIGDNYKEYVITSAEGGVLPIYYHLDIVRAEGTTGINRIDTDETVDVYSITGDKLGSCAYADISRKFNDRILIIRSGKGYKKVLNLKR